MIKISLKPTTQTQPPLPSKKKQLIKNFRETIENSGYFELDSETIKNLQQEGILPLDYKPGEVAASLNLYSLGAKSIELAEKTKGSSFLNEKQKASLYRIAHILEVLENSEIKGSPNSKDIYLENGEPQISIEEAVSPIPQTNQVLFKTDPNFLTPVFKEVAGVAYNFANRKAKEYAIKALKAGGKKLLKEGSKIAAKYGVKLATKVGVKLGIQALGQTIGSLAPGVGNLIAAIASFLLTDVLPKILGAFSKFLGLITGEKDTRKQLLWLSLLGVVGFLGLGMVPLAIASALAALGLGGAIIGGVGMIGGILGIPLLILAGLLIVIIVVFVIPLVIALIVIPIIIAFVLFIINSGAFIVPPHSSLSPGIIQSPYIEVKKIVNPKDTGKCQGIPGGPNIKTCNNGELPVTFEYTITVRALKGTLTNIRFQNNCQVTKEGSKPVCSHPIPNPPQLISPTKDFTFSYTQTYTNPDFRDSQVIDSFTVTADAPSEGITNINGASSAIVRIGNPPSECPSIWPALPDSDDEGGTLYVIQGPYTTCEKECTHGTIDAIDIAPKPQNTFTGNAIYATHAGTATLGNYGNYGNFVDVTSFCKTDNGGVIMITSRYAHLSAFLVTPGTSVVLGQVVGLGGNSGTKVPHLHYEFRPASNPSLMRNPYLPLPPGVSVPKGCYDYVAGNPCNIQIP